MSLLPQIVYEVPEETARIARAAFPKGNPYLPSRCHLPRWRFCAALPLHRTRRTGRGPGRVWNPDCRPGGGGSQLASAPVARFCQSAVPSGLGMSSRDLYGRPRKSLLVAEHLSAQWRRLGSPVCQSDLHALRSSGAMYPREGGATPDRLTAPRPGRSLTTTPGGARHAGVSRGVCGARRHRRHAFPKHPAV